MVNLIDLAFAQGSLPSEAQAEFGSFCKHLFEGDLDKSRNLAIEAETKYLAVRSRYQALLSALSASGLSQMEIWALRQGEAINLQPQPLNATLRKLREEDRSLPKGGEL